MARRTIARKRTASKAGRPGGVSARVPVMKTYKLYINGKFPRSESGRYYPLARGAGELIANVCRGSRKDFRDAVVAARAACGAWSGPTMNLNARVSWVSRAGALPGLLLVLAIRGYQRFISPWTVSSCRYYPSCSQYAADAVTTHGPFRGSWLAARRLGRCHPWTAGGVDYPPPPTLSRAHRRSAGPQTATFA